MSNLIPSFFVYGEETRPVEIGFVHVETVMARKFIHLGQVKAHKHDHMAQITFWTKGRGTYFIEESRLDFSAPAVSFVPSNIVHGFSVDADNSDAVVISIADAVLLQIKSMIRLSADHPVMIAQSSSDRLWDRLTQIITLIETEYREQTEGSQHVISPLIAAALVEIGRLAATVPQSDPLSQSDLSSRLRNLVNLHFRENWTVGDYVKRLNTTPHLLAKATETAFGVSIKDLIMERRLLEAKRLLMFTIRSLDDIAFDVGIKDSAYFSRFFKNRTGLPPSEWRQKQGNNV